MQFSRKLLDTASCPHCHQAVDAQAVACPYCRTPLKAYGHPGIPLHYATGEVPLCQSCTYHEDDTCTFPQRPYARECTLYQSRLIEIEQRHTPNSLAFATKNWFKRRQALLVLLGLLGLAFLFASRSHPQTIEPKIHPPQSGQQGN